MEIALTVAVVILFIVIGFHRKVINDLSDSLEEVTARLGAAEERLGLNKEA